MTYYGGLDNSSPALRLLRLVHAREQVTGCAILDEDQRRELDYLLDAYTGGSSTALETRACTLLATYRELDKHGGTLDADERAQFAQLLDRQPQRTARRATPAFEWPNIRLRWVITLGVVLLVITAIFGIRSIVTAQQSGPPPGTSQQNPPAQQVPPGTTDLQNLKQAWGPWQTESPSDQRPQTGSPALLLLEGGGYSSSEEWTVAPNASGWNEDLGGHVTNVDVKGDHADITDGEGNPYIVATNQPFVEASDPNTILRIDPTGKVFSITLAQATAVRHHLTK